MGEVVFGVDFKARRMRELEENALEIMNVALFGVPMVIDTAPSEYCAPENDPA